MGRWFQLKLGLQKLKVEQTLALLTTQVRQPAIS
jgi:hypothetical protein